MNKSYDGKKILVVDDDLPSIIIVEKLLKGTGLEIIRARNGVEAVDLAETKNIDAILMDIKMPIISGYDATRAIRKFNPNIPIIAYTAYALNGDRQKCLDAGCNDYLAKPVYPKDMLAMIAKYLK